LTENRIFCAVPVFHESGIIRETIDHIGSLDGGEDVEIIVVDGAREADTLDAVGHPDVIKLPSRRGRGVQMNLGAETATGDILLFLHADTKLPPNGLTLIKRCLDDVDIKAGAFTLSFDSAPLLLRMTLPAHEARCRLTRMPYGDQSIFMKRETFLQIGGYANYRIMEDADLMRRMKKAGMKIRILTEKVRTSPRRFEEKGVVRTLSENLAIVILFHLGVDPEKLADIYYGE